MKQTFILLSILNFAVNSFATTYYLRADGTASKDQATSCSSASQSMNVATHNISTFLPGDIIVICGDGGLFSNRINPISSGTATNPIEYNTSGSPIISTYSVDSLGIISVDREGVLIRNQSWITINGPLEIKKNERYGIYIRADASNEVKGIVINNVTIDNSLSYTTIDRANFGLFAHKLTGGHMSRITISNCTIIGNTETNNSDAVALSEVDSEITFHNNIIKEAKGQCLDVTGGINHLFYGNYFDGTHDSTVNCIKLHAQLSPLKNVKFYNNLLITEGVFPATFKDLDSSLIINNSFINKGTSYGALEIDIDLNGNSIFKNNTIKNNLFLGDWASGLIRIKNRTGTTLRNDFEADNNLNSNIYWQDGGNSNLIVFEDDIANTVKTSNFSSWKTNHLSDLNTNPELSTAYIPTRESILLNGESISQIHNLAGGYHDAYNKEYFSYQIPIGALTDDLNSTNPPYLTYLSSFNKSVDINPSPTSVNDSVASITIPSAYNGSGIIVIRHLIGTYVTHKQITLNNGNTWNWNLTDSNGIKIQSGTYVVEFRLQNLQGDYKHEAIIYFDVTCEDNNGNCDTSNDCIDNLYIPDTMTGIQVYEAANKIESDAKVLQSSDIEFSAGQEIILQPGFETSQSSTFHAYILGCSN